MASTRYFSLSSFSTTNFTSSIFTVPSLTGASSPASIPAKYYAVMALLTVPSFKGLKIW